MSTWMLYAALVSLLVCVAASTLERALQGGRAPVRWIWVAAMAASCTIPVLTWGQPAREVVDVPATTLTTRVAHVSDMPPPAVVSRPSGFLDLFTRTRFGWTSPALPRTLDPWAALAWGLLSLSVVGAVVRSYHGLRRARREWTPERLDGRYVLVSDRIGPAVVGLLRPAIVLPSWALEARRTDRELILRHEEEHRRARDPQLLFASLLLLALLPWNLPLWWQARRLRMAVEVDCDRRVLRHTSDLRRYASLLVEMSRRGTIGRLSALALAHPKPFLERRIRTMTTQTTPKRVATVGFALMACLFVTAAVRVQAPVPSLERTPAPESNASAAGDALLQPTLEGESSSAAQGAPSPRAPTVSARKQQGHISGRVLDERSDAGLSLVQVYIAGGYQGTLTGSDGGFEIRDVPAGTYELRAERVGLTVGSREITVLEGGTVEVTFELSARSIGLDEIRSDGSPEAPTASTPPTRVRLRDVPPGAVVFTPMTVHPRVTNVAEVQAALRREYPETLRNAGIGGSVIMNVFVDADGRPQNKVIDRSSRNDRLDDAALRIVGEMRFSPARNRDQPIAVWVTLPLTFRP